MTKELGRSRLGIAVLANFAGSVWGTAITFVFVPIYLRYLGAEGYGIVGFSSTLLAIVTFLDGGLTLTINREMARLSHSFSGVDRMRQVLAAGTALFSLMSLLVALIIWVGAPWIAQNWLNASTLGQGEITFSIRLIGLVLGEQLLIAVFQGAMMGLHRQEMLNLVLIATSTIRAVGAFLILKYVDDAPSAFFAWYGFVLLIQMAALRLLLGAYIGGKSMFQLPNIQMIRFLLRSTTGFGVIAIFSLLLSQIDKVLVSRLLSLEDFGYYMVAVAVGLTAILVAAPITNALFPRLSQLAASDRAGAMRLFHMGTQMVTALVAPLGMMFALFAPELIFAWTGDATMTAHIAPLATVLGVGYAINASMQTGYYFEMAYARTRAIIWLNAITLILLIPSIAVLSNLYGALGAASCWLLVNLGYLVIGMPLVLRRGLGKDLAKLYWNDLLPCYASAGLVVGTARLLVPDGLSRISSGVIVSAILGLAILTSCFAAPLLRSYGFQQGRRLHSRLVCS